MKIPVIKWQSFLIRLYDFINFLKELVILIVAVFVFTPLSLAGFLYTAGKHLFVKRDYSISKQFGSVVKALTLANDGISNAWSGELLNDLFKPKYVKYGKWYQTISAITGINYLKGDDKRFRKALDKILGDKHCKNAITNEQKTYYNL